MSDDARSLELLANIRETIDVYADHLESLGDLDRASIVRELRALEFVTWDDPALLPRARAAIGLTANHSRAWLAHFAHPPLAGTVWAGRNHAGDSPYTLEFRTDGMMVFTQNEGDVTNGPWIQIGRMVAFRINNYSPHEAVFDDTRMIGYGSNDGGTKWSFKAVKVDPAFLDDQGLISIAEYVHDGESQETVPRYEWVD